MSVNCASLVVASSALEYCSSVGNCALSNLCCMGMNGRWLVDGGLRDMCCLKTGGIKVVLGVGM
jgi:hypothetical protein